MKTDKSLKRSIECTIKDFGFPFLLMTYTMTLWFFPQSATFLLLAFAVAGMALEKWIPYHAEWQGIKTDSKIDAIFSVLTILVSVILKSGTTVVLSRAGMESRVWPSWPLPISVLVALVISGLGPYLLHRAAHEWSAIMWQVHAVHHAPDRVYSLNAMRTHPLNAAWNVLAGLGPLLLLGADSQTILIAGSLNNFFSIFNHMNIDFRNPMLSIFFNTSELHRWHHSTKQELGDKNYSSGAIALWDHVFGTWRLPAERFKSNGAGLFAANDFPGYSLSKQLLRPICRCA
jgi:sterol desaturase/sphingolipid hydroxylase (fatty acid hydroxylase superfamily)